MTIAVAVTVGVLLAARSAAGILILVVIAMVLAVGLDPLVRWIEGRGLARAWAVAIVVLGALVIVIGFGLLVLPTLIHQLAGLGDDIPQYLSNLQARDDWLGNVMRSNHISESVRSFIADLPRQVGDSFGTILGVASKVGSVVFAAVTTTILTIYFMVSLPRMRETATIVVLPHQRKQAVRVLDSSIDRIGGYVTGNVITSVICGAVTLAALLVAGVPFAVPLAVWAGFADLIPAVGSYLGAAPAVLVAFLSSPVLGIGVVAYFIVYQQIENYVLVPRIMRNTVHLSPAAVIIATLIGASLAGFAGALLALPVAASIKVVVIEVWLRDRVRRGDSLAKDRMEDEVGDPAR